VHHSELLHNTCLQYEELMTRMRQNSRYTRTRLQDEERPIRKGWSKDVMEYLKYSPR
jgi:hypothetical protein